MASSTKDAVSKFSSSYEEARDRFLEAAAAAGFSTASYPLKGIPGPDETELFVDCAFLKGKDVREGVPPRTCFVHSSGTHGVEGYVGSAIQLLLLATAKDDPEVLRPPEDGITLLIHAVNPYGFAWNRRFNEGNCDLNRNWLTPEAFEEGAKQGLPELFGLYKGLVCPDYLPNPSSCIEWLWVQSQMLLAISRFGLDALKEAVAKGHHVLPKAMYFAGTEMQLAPRLIQKMLLDVGVTCPLDGGSAGSASATSEPELMGWRPSGADVAGRLWEGVRGPQKVVVLDVHSGLGKPAQSSLLMTGTGAGEEAHAVREALGFVAHDAAAGPKEMLVQDSEELGAGGVAYKCQGGFSAAMAALPGPGGMPILADAEREEAGCRLTSKEVASAYGGMDATDRLGVAQEFGTVPATEVFVALRAEAALFAREPFSPPSHPLRQRLMRVFYPDDDWWRRECVGKGVSVALALCRKAFED